MREEFYQKAWMFGWLVHLTTDFARPDEEVYLAHKVRTLHDPTTCAMAYFPTYEEAVEHVRKQINYVEGEPLKVVGLPQKPEPIAKFELSVLYDKGLGLECLNLPVFESTVTDAQRSAEEIATATFLEKFGKRVQWEEVKIRPARG